MHAVDVIKYFPLHVTNQFSRSELKLFSPRSIYW